MKSNRIAVFSVIFEQNLVFFPEFLNSLVNQKDRNFDLVLIVDGTPNISGIVERFRKILNIRCFEIEGTIATIRERALELIKELDYWGIVCADTDDIQSELRTQVCRRALEEYSIVVNDLAPFVEYGNWNSDTLWTCRLGKEFSFTASDIKHSNFVGLGNSSFRTELLRNSSMLRIPPENEAPDWFLFFQLLEHSQGVFLQDGHVHYRQHGNNTLGINLINEEKLAKIQRIKINHYKALTDYYPDLKKLYLREVELKEKGESERLWLSERLQLLNHKALNFFWWEETEYL